MAWNYKALFKTAFEHLKVQVDRHDVGCGCQEEEDSVKRGGCVEGPCPGLMEAKKFIAQVERKVHEK